VTRKRSKRKAGPAITGVASGSLGTAANLDETQVLRTADLRAAAPQWFDDGEADDEAPSDVVLPAPAPIVAATVQPRSGARTGRAPWRRSITGRTPALVGAAAVAILLLVAGAGFLSQLDLGSSSGPGGPGQPSFGFAIEAPPSASPEPGSGKGHGNCKGKGHGDCD
jgi:hypothetical protein